MGNIQSAVDVFASRAASDKFQLNETPNFNPIVINDKQIYVVSHAKNLGVNISSDLKWNHDISEVVKKPRNAYFFSFSIKARRFRP